MGRSCPPTKNPISVLEAIRRVRACQYSARDPRAESPIKLKFNFNFTFEYKFQFSFIVKFQTFIIRYYFIIVRGSQLISSNSQWSYSLVRSVYDSHWGVSGSSRYYSEVVSVSFMLRQNSVISDNNHYHNLRQ